MNRLFVSVKVDREERPDVDAIYMDAVVSLTGSGGWPMTVFLTPDGRPFWGGTYFPPEPRHGLPSFRQVLEGVAEAYRDAPRRGRPAGRPAAEAIGSRTAAGAAGRRAPALTLTTRSPPCAAVRRACTAASAERRSSRRRRARVPAARGGSTATRRCAMAVRDARRDGRRRHPRPARRRLPPLRGRRVWLVPHFEKMLYDNALLARAYAHACEAHGRRAVRRRSRATCSTTSTARCAPDGGGAASARTPTPTATRG